ncbi:MAG TPA: DinB family protein [Candidatus Dormibacteraeota bacterium]|nr:DinB family protein [Candidatus Dormibacteraeota bacterium]
MTDIAELRQRVLRSRERLHAIPYLGNGEPGPPDPETGERWNRGHVLGHLGDVLRFWPVQVRAVLAGAAWVGRGEDGYADRRRAIESGPERDERALREEIDAGIDDLLRLLEEASSADLGRLVEHRRARETRSKTVGGIIEQVLVAHLESHVRQLEELSRPGG